VVAIVLELLNEMKAFDKIHPCDEKAIGCVAKNKNEREREGKKGKLTLDSAL
jgi:hypothetical protein